MNIKSLLALFVLCVMLTACSGDSEAQVEIDQNAVPADSQMPADGSEAVETIVETAPEDSNSAPAQTILEDDTTAEASSNSQVKEFEMIAKRFEFSPNVITVNRGDRVIIHATAADVMHGISIPEYGVNVQLPTGETKDIEFIADEPGEFNFRCSVFCGSGHSQHRGSLIVQ